jgi:hypothetical protein
MSYEFSGAPGWGRAAATAHEAVGGPQEWSGRGSRPLPTRPWAVQRKGAAAADEGRKGKHLGSYEVAASLIQGAP